jgi:Rho-binding antiterminator
MAMDDTMRNSEYTPIDCDDHDMLEIACLDRYEIVLSLDTGDVRGRAEDLQVRSGEEFLVIRTAADRMERIRADRIRELVVLSRPARFERHRFAAA